MNIIDTFNIISVQNATDGWLVFKNNLYILPKKQVLSYLFEDIAYDQIREIDKLRCSHLVLTLKNYPEWVYLHYKLFEYNRKPDVHCL